MRPKKSSNKTLRVLLHLQMPPESEAYGLHCSLKCATEQTMLLVCDLIAFGANPPVCVLTQDAPQTRLRFVRALLTATRAFTKIHAVTRHPTWSCASFRLFGCWPCFSLRCIWFRDVKRVQWFGGASDRAYWDSRPFWSWRGTETFYGR